jgi:isoleucyl-tRNA synthetase
MVPILEEESGMTCGLDFKVGYSPERINPGDLEHTLEHIYKIVAGMDEESTAELAELYGMITNVYLAPDIRTAEAAKVIENVQRDLNIALFNELSLIFEKMGIDMQAVIDVVSLGRTARGESNIKIRQPLGKMYVPAKLKTSLDKMLDLVKEEVNIQQISYVEEDSNFVQYELKPQFKVMGPKYGQKMKAIAANLPKVDAAKVLHSFATKGSYEFDLDGDSITLLPEDLQVQILPREGYTFASMKDIFIALDTTLNEELITEGYARELINKIQYSRKEQGFEIMDRIKVHYNADTGIDQAFAQYGDYIKSETLADEILKTNETLPNKVDINGKEIGLVVQKNS